MNTETKTQYLVIGSGRTGRHMIRYLQALDLPCTSWSRSQSFSDLKALCEPATHILLSISDREIQNFAQTHLAEFLSVKKIIHFSGALVISGLIDAHPLMTFTDDLYDLQTYRSISFISSSSERQILPGLENRFFHINPEQKALYHALCVASGNFTTLLWQKMKSGLAEMNIPFEAAHPYLLQITQNLIHHPDTALTGPIARQDLPTVKANHQAFAGDSFQEIYRAFIHTYYKEAQI